MASARHATNSAKRVGFSSWFVLTVGVASLIAADHFLRTDPTPGGNPPRQDQTRSIKPQKSTGPSPRFKIHDKGVGSHFLDGPNQSLVIATLDMDL